MSEHFSFRYYVGHRGKFGHEFMEFEIRPNGTLRYANNSNYKNDSMIRKEVKLNTCVVNELRRIVEESGITGTTDDAWPEPNNIGKQELEITIGDKKIIFETAKIGSLNDVKDSEDPESLRILYYLVQDVKCMFSSLIQFHFKVKPFG